MYESQAHLLPDKCGRESQHNSVSNVILVKTAHKRRLWIATESPSVEEVLEKFPTLSLEQKMLAWCNNCICLHACKISQVLHFFSCKESCVLNKRRTSRRWGTRGVIGQPASKDLLQSRYRRRQNSVEGCSSKEKRKFMVMKLVVSTIYYRLRTCILDINFYIHSMLVCQLHQLLWAAVCAPAASTTVWVDCYTPFWGGCDCLWHVQRSRLGAVYICEWCGLM